MKKTYIILGIGNPEKKFSKSPHNLGLLASDILKDQLKTPPFQKNESTYTLVTMQQLKEIRLILAKSTVYMNESGVCAKAILKKEQLSPAHLIVLQDDIDTNIGTLKIKQSGSANGHNGIRSIIENIGTDQFTRIKIGAAHLPRIKDENTSEYVLQPMTDHDYEQSKAAIQEQLVPLLEKIVDEQAY